MADANERPKLMPISPGGIPSALVKAERYRYLNEPMQAESICRDVIAIDPANHAALVLLLLALTDQIQPGGSTREMFQIAEGLGDEYSRAYYAGIIHERQAIAVFRQNSDYRSRRQMLTLIQNAMEAYRKARELESAERDDATLRWNACVRFLERNWGLQ